MTVSVRSNFRCREMADNPYYLKMSGTLLWIKWINESLGVVTLEFAIMWGKRISCSCFSWIGPLDEEPVMQQVFIDNVDPVVDLIHTLCKK